MTVGRPHIQYQLISKTDGAASSRCWSKCWAKLCRYKTVVCIIAVLSVLFLFLYGLNSDFVRSAAVCLFSKTSNTSSLHVNSRMHFHHSKRQLPQCLIIGVRKAGTRALLQFMKLHPSVQGAGVEIHFFDKDKNYELGYEWYRHQMPYSFNGQITMEKTPAYFTDADVPQRVYAMNSSIKILLIVRDPVERAISDYAQLLDNHVKRNLHMKTFEELAVNWDTGEINKSYVVIKRSIYHRHLQKWLHFFPLKQIHIVDGDNLRTAPWEEVYDVESYLGLEHKIERHQFSFNATKGLFCPKTKSGRERCLAPGKGRKHPEVDFSVIQKLKEFYRPHNEKFFRILSRRFPW